MSLIGLSQKPIGALDPLPMADIRSADHIYVTQAVQPRRKRVSTLPRSCERASVRASPGARVRATALVQLTPSRSCTPARSHDYRLHVLALEIDKCPCLPVATRLDAVEFNVLKDLTIPVLIAHGALDRDGTPVESARELIRLLKTEKANNFEYWEIPEMGHGIGNVESVRRERLFHALFNWLLNQPPGPGGPPTFGLDSKGMGPGG